MATQTKYGLGFSPLSMRYAKENAFVQEMVADKNVGMFGIVVDNEKNIVSHEYLARTKVHLDNFITRLVQDNTLGKLYKIRAHEYLVTMITDRSTDLIDGADIFIPNGDTKIKGIRFNFDIDVYDPSASALIHYKNIDIVINMELCVGPSSKTISIRNSLAYINTTAYALDYSGLEGETGDVVLKIKNIFIVPGDDFDFNVNKIALYDILVCSISGKEKTVPSNESNGFIYDEDNG